MLIVLDAQHQGKPSHPNDRGASSGGLEEVTVTRAYVEAADHELRRLGHQVIVLSDGEYSARWARADAYGAQVYVACHADAGGGNRGEVFFDHRSHRGPALATAVATALHSALEWPVVARACHPDDDGEPRDEDYSEAYNCIQGVRAVAVLVEPGFVDGSPAHVALLRSPAVGVALAQGIDAWARAATPGP